MLLIAMIGLSEPGIARFALRLSFGVSAAWLAAGVAAYLLRRSSAALRHRIWSLSVLAALLLPAAIIALPEWPLGTIHLPENAMPSTAEAPRADLRPLIAGADTAREELPTRAAPLDRFAASMPDHNPSAARDHLADPPPADARHVEPSTARLVEPFPPHPRRQSSFALWISLAWLLPAVWLLVRQCIGMLAARRLLRDSTTIETGPAALCLARLVARQPVRPMRMPRLMESDALGSPICRGCLCPSIMLPATWRQWPRAQLEAVLTHELAHVARCDVLWQALARTVCALYWPHPLAWVAAWRMRAERELACDDWVLRGGESSKRYAHWLLDVATFLTRRAPLAERAAVAMASRPGLEKRVSAVLDPNRRRFAVSRRMSIGLTALAVLLLAVVGTLSPLAPNRAQAAAEGKAISPAKPSVVTPEISTPRVAGQVVDERGKPVADVLVQIGAAFEQHSSQTDADGRFSMNAPAHPMRFGTLVARTHDGARQASFRFDGGDPTPAQATNLKFVLRPAREFPVTVTDGKGNPVEGATVLGDSWYSAIGDAITDSAGKALLRLPADAQLLHILAIKPAVGLDYFQFRGKDQPKTDPYQLAPDFVGPLNFVLNGAKVVTVKVVNEQRHPLTGAKVYPWMFEKPAKGTELNLSGDPGFTQVTDAEGLARMPVPIDQTMPVVFWLSKDGFYAPKRCMWDPKSGKTEIEAHMVRQVRVTGTAVGPDGGPLADVTVRVEGDGYGDDYFRGEVQTAVDGTFHIDVNGDTYYMFVASKGRLTSAAHMQLIREGSRPLPLRLEMKPGTRVYGRVLVGRGNAPVPRAGLTLIYQDEQTYLKLPPEEQLAGGVAGRKSIMANVVRFSNADDAGAFEYFLSPGSYRLNFWSPSATARKEFRVGNEKELQFDVRAQPSDPMTLLKGRVVLAEKPGVLAGEAKIAGRGTDSGTPWTDAIADAHGGFTLQRAKGDLYVCATSADESLRGIIRVKAGEDDVAVPIVPTAVAHGRLKDAAGNFLAGTAVQYGMEIVYPNRSSNWNFGGELKTAGDGSFTLKGLVPGIEYVVYAVTDYNADGWPNSYHLIGKAKAAKAGSLDLGTLKILPDAHALDAADRMKQAFGQAKPLADRLAEAQHVARICHQNVLVVLGSPDRTACRQFYEWRENFDMNDVLADYLVVAADVDGNGTREWADRLKLPWPSGGASFAVLDPDGRLLATTSDQALSVAGKLDRRRLIDFARAHAPVLPDAQKLLDDVLAKAKREGKNVLFDESGASCPWCVKLADYLEANRALIEKDFVWVTIDRRFTHGQQVIERLHKENAGIPWTSILTPDGRTIVTSDGPKGNIGFPGEPGGQEQWEKMLRAGARRLTDADIRQLLAAVKPPALSH